MPAELTANAVGDGGDKLSSKTKLRAQLQCKRLWWVLSLWHVPLKLVHQRDVSNVDVQLRNKINTLIFLYHLPTYIPVLQQQHVVLIPSSLKLQRLNLNSSLSGKKAWHSSTTGSKTEDSLPPRGCEGRGKDTAWGERDRCMLVIWNNRKYCSLAA